MLHHAFCFFVSSSDGLASFPLSVYYPDASFFAMAEERQSTKTIMRGIFWLAQPLTLVHARLRTPAFVHVDVQVQLMEDYDDYFEHSLWYGKPVQVVRTHRYGDWPSEDAFLDQRPQPGWHSDAALCYYDVRKTSLSYGELVNKYYAFICKHPTYMDTCFHMYRSLIV
jgi:hypothetical protein